MIIGRVPLVTQDNKTVYFDYQGAILPQGIAEDKSVFFNSDEIDSVAFPGLARK